MVQRIYKSTSDKIIFIDNLLVGKHPDTWLGMEKNRSGKNFATYDNERLLFIEDDARNTIRALRENENYFTEFNFECTRIADVVHFAAIVGGRAMIDGDPMAVALDLAIDAELFYWACNYKPERLLYPSSSAAYPVDLQTENNALKLKESDIDFKRMGQPDRTYGWSKLTGEFLAKIAAQYYGLKVTVPTTLGIESKAKKEERAKHHAKKKESVKHAAKHGKPKSGLGEASKAETGAPAAPTSK